MITASMLYNFIECPERTARDLFADPALKDKENPFVTLLWERGTKYEAEVIQGLTADVPNLRPLKLDDRLSETLRLMKAKTPLIYGGRIQADNLLGEPDLLRYENGGYAPIDIKSGRGEEGGGDDADEDDGKPKVRYAVQLGLYIDVLQRMGLSAGSYAYVFDIDGNEVRYDFTEVFGSRKQYTLLEKYQTALSQVRLIVDQQSQPMPAYSSVCKLCHWYSSCLGELRKSNDLTLMFDLGRAKREILLPAFKNLHELAAANPNQYIRGTKTVFPGIGPETLRKFQRRAALNIEKDGQPYLSEPVNLPDAPKEIYFDIEVDPLRNFCYLHGFVERDRTTQKSAFKPFFADRVDPALEKQAFAAAWKYVADNPGVPVFFYSKYERTWWRNLATRYTDVCSVAEVDALFAAPHFIDLYYGVVRGKTEWPTIDYSIKTLAKHLGFNWRDVHPSGAASIEWFDQWVTTGDTGVRERILQYNEDDCVATGVLADGIRAMARSA